MICGTGSLPVPAFFDNSIDEVVTKHVLIVRHPVDACKFATSDDLTVVHDPDAAFVAHDILIVVETERRRVVVVDGEVVIHEIKWLFDVLIEGLHYTNVACFAVVLEDFELVQSTISDGIFGACSVVIPEHALYNRCSV